MTRVKVQGFDLKVQMNCDILGWYRCAGLGSICRVGTLRIPTVVNLQKKMYESTKRFSYKVNDATLAVRSSLNSG